MSTAPSPSTALALEALLGPDCVSTAPADLEPFLTDHRRLYHGRAAALVRPRTVDQVAAILRCCHEHRIGVVPQGGNTGYCGGATPDESGTQIILSLARLNAIRRLDPLDYSMVAEAGCLLANLQQAALDAGRFFPLMLGSAGSCQLGGNLSTNAGGVNVLRYGMMRELVLGLEVVLPDGRVLPSLTALRKDNTGYDLKSLFLGAEGTLGVITAASLKLFPHVAARATAFAAVKSVRAAVELLELLRTAADDRVSSFELIPRLAVELAVRHIPGVTAPLAGSHEWYVLAELGSTRTDAGLDELLEHALGEGLQRGLVLDAVLAQNARQAQAFWHLREHIPAAQTAAGASLKHDLSVPVAALPEFVERGAAWVREHVPEGRLVAYGHAGDGNLHFNISQGPGTAGGALLARAQEVQRALHDLVREFAGSFSAEHGIGRLKVGELERYAPAVELDLMHAVKRAFDPHGIMNPGKVLRRSS
ncbi:MAG TPA: FAD-binding oxidoreductase [Steroidobacteraceae bacterium]|nr:FAD-binding oxidoreductase [Steroidobacteraceae bacterium]